MPRVRRVALVAELLSPEAQGDLCALHSLHVAMRDITTPDRSTLEERVCQAWGGAVHALRGHRGNESACLIFATAWLVLADGGGVVPLARAGGAVPAGLRCALHIRFISARALKDKHECFAQVMAESVRTADYALDEIVVHDDRACQADGTRQRWPRGTTCTENSNCGFGVLSIVCFVRQRKGYLQLGSSSPWCQEVCWSASGLSQCPCMRMRLRSNACVRCRQQAVTGGSHQVVLALWPSQCCAAASRPVECCEAQWGMDSH